MNISTDIKIIEVCEYVNRFVKCWKSVNGFLEKHSGLFHKNSLVIGILLITHRWEMTDDCNVVSLSSHGPHEASVHNIMTRGVCRKHP